MVFKMVAIENNKFQYFLASFFKVLFVKNILVWLLLFLFCGELNAQLTNTSFPIIKNFDRSEYNAGMQTWMISQAPNDLMYFANNQGLLEFDGHNWELHGLAGYTNVRSVLAAENGKIYVGLSDNFGYFVTDSTGRKQFYSLLHLLPPGHQNIEEIWRIYNTSDGVVYQTFNELIVLKNNKVTIYKAPTGFYLSYHINNSLYILDWGEGVLEFKNGEFHRLKGTKKLPNTEVAAIMPFGKELMIATAGKGVFIYSDNNITKWETPSNEFLLEHQIYSALRLDENYIAFGTIQKGLLICDNEGNIVAQIDKSTGLQNNTILSMTLDKSGNLWLGTNNGIDLLNINSPISQLGFNLGFGSGYSAAIHKNVLYLGTNQGLYFKYLDDERIERNGSNFKPIARLKGQVWSLKLIGDELFCGHNKGAYLIYGSEVKKIGKIPGTWMYMQSEKYPNRIIAGTYTGLILFEKVDGKWLFKKRIFDFKESSRMMFFDEDETIWMSHGFKGEFKIKLTETYHSIVENKFYNTKKGFYTDYGINIAKLQNQIVFLSSYGVFKYDATNDTIVSSTYFNNFFGNTNTNYALEDIYGNIWSYNDFSLTAKLIKKDGSYKTVTMPFKQLKGRFIEGFQFVYPINESNFFISFEDGFVIYDSEKEANHNIPFNLYLNKVILSNTDSTIYDGHLFANKTNNKPLLEFENNSLHFYFSAVHFENPQKVEFATFLEGYDENWSNWESRYDREFTNLPEGNYAFHIKARNIYNIETEAVVYYFNIKPPWTRTTMAYLLYAGNFLIVALLLIFAVRKRINYLKLHEERVQKQKYIEREKELQNEALVAEKEIIRLKNEQLQGTLKTKDKELANSTMDTIKKNKFLISLKKDMQKNNAEMKSEAAKSQNKKLVRKIDNEINNEKNWKVFETHFTNVHEEFLSKLKQQYPQISPAELRLCACLRMNISSKEIASLLNISVRGVEASRYRLRKALDLDRETNLTDFILTI
jgi:DNA-binding CsgD family transcriptional regulator